MANTKPVPKGITKTEPTGLIGSISAAIVAVIGLLVAFGVDLTSEQTGAIVTAFSAVAIVIQTIITRNSVYSPASTQRAANAAAQTADATIPAPPGNGTAGDPHR